MMTIISMNITASAYNDSNFVPKIEVMGVIEAIEDLIDTIEDIGEVLAGSEDNLAIDTCTAILASINSVADFGWSSIKTEISDDSWSDFRSNNGTIIDAAIAVTSIAAYAFAALFFMIGCLNKLYKYREISDKQVLELVARAVVIGVWIYYSAYICGVIYDLNAQLVEGVFNSTDAEIALSFFSNDLTESEAVEGSGVPILGFLVDLFNTLAVLFPRLIASLVMLIVSWCVSIKLIIRSLECVCLISVSPLFFAALASEPTTPYFKNFITSYIGVVCETLFMAITYVAGYTVYNNYLQEQAAANATINSAVATGGGIPTGDFRIYVIVIAIGVCMLTPPKALKSLVNA